MERAVKKSDTLYFPNLDGLRSVAALIVFIAHSFVVTFDKLQLKGSFAERLIHTIGYGQTGVSIFFVLSGFLITYLLLHEIALNDKINVRFFYVRRFLRIWPLYFLVLFIGLVVHPALKSHFGSNYVHNTNAWSYLLFLANFDVIKIARLAPETLTFITVTWSVAVEEQFYLIWPLLFFFINKRYYPYIFLSIIIFSLIYRIVNAHEEVLLTYHSFSVCLDLATGGLFAYYTFYNFKLRAFFENLNGGFIALGYLAGFVWLMYGANHLTQPYLFASGRLISVLFFAFIILEQNFSIHSFYKFSNNRFLTYWGRYTYGIYLLNSIAIWITEIFETKIFKISNAESITASLVANIAAFGLTLFLSYISYEYFEKFFLKLKHKFTSIPRSDAY